MSDVTGVSQRSIQCRRGGMSKVYQIPLVQWDWEPWFAWYPVKLEEGGKAWFRRIYKRQCWCVIFYNEYTSSAGGSR